MRPSTTNPYQALGQATKTPHGIFAQSRSAQHHLISHKKNTRLMILMLPRLNNVTPTASYKTGHLRNDPRPVGTTSD
jgi:hypothetical protein